MLHADGMGLDPTTNYQTVRSDVVTRLTHLAVTAMLDEAGDRRANAAEVFSACFTVAYHAVLTAKTLGVDTEAFRDGLLKILSELPKVN